MNANIACREYLVSGDKKILGAYIKK